MTAEQKLKRALEKSIEDILEWVQANPWSLNIDEEYAETIRICVNECSKTAKKYYKDLVREEHEKAAKKSREWQIRHMKEHPESWQLIAIDAKGLNVVPVDIKDFKWFDPKSNP